MVPRWLLLWALAVAVITSLAGCGRSKESVQQSRSVPSSRFPRQP
jgi:hypothetical protein